MPKFFTKHVITMLYQSLKCAIALLLTIFSTAALSAQNDAKALYQNANYSIIQKVDGKIVLFDKDELAVIDTLEAIDSLNVLAGKRYFITDSNDESGDVILQGVIGDGFAAGAFKGILHPIESVDATASSKNAKAQAEATEKAAKKADPLQQAGNTLKKWTKARKTTEATQSEAKKTKKLLDRLKGN